jgi:transposase
LTLNALLGFTVSSGFLARVHGAVTRLLERDFLPAVRALIATTPVAHADETAARAQGALRHLRVRAPGT